MSVVYMYVVWKEKERERKRERGREGERETDQYTQQKSTLLSVVEVQLNTVARLNMNRSHV